MTALTHTRLLRIAAPIVISNATVPLLGAVDTGVVGQMGQAAPIGAVGLGAIVLTTLYWVFGFLRMGTTGLAAQAHGAGDGAERGAILLRALLVGAAAGLAFVILQRPLFHAAFAIAPAGDGVETLARQYLSIRIWGAPATIAAYALTGWLIAVERTRAVLLLQLWINGVNIALDLWFVLALGWGVGGVALATLIAEWSGLALGLWLCRDGLLPVWRAALARIPDRTALATMFAVNRDIMIRSVLLQLCFTSFVFLGARMGDVTLAANQVLMQFLSITAYALDGFAFAAETLVGQAVGARALPDARRAARMAMQWGAGTSLLLGAAFLAAGPALIDLMTTAPDVRGEARAFLPWVAAAPVIGVYAWIYDGIFIGATLTAQMRRAMIASVAAYAVALALLVPLLDNHGLWAALMVFFAARGLTMHRAMPALADRIASRPPPQLRTSRNSVDAPQPATAAITSDNSP
ncbi:MATE family efflux transporter [Rhodobacteraceae bacterium HSP-20]|uniref:MATE family efflux transporter n=1 Tax=Paragemmobacter amnigenus TaxID=2852097 RepID=A0ABS6J7Y3_9RHOB|nr:MATE family efflux transporter [Rhodobacter amnigenus]MBU9699860.1 MATE family efflux transporter [Rhodobacter amnigenus]MBV4391087.1 MATE family efflux transporter [Rhodobacter amnigenus]